MRRIEPPILGLVLGDCVQIQDGVYKGPTHSHLGQRTNYVKVLPRGKLLVECVAAMVGRAHDLPIPAPFLLMAAGRFLPGEDSAFDYWAFGSEASSFPSLSRLTRDRDEICKRLLGWKRVHEAAAFDTWIGNEDRTSKNILWADDATQVTLIDHDDALPDWLQPEAETVNQILQLLCDNKSEFERHKARQTALRATGGYTKTDWAGAMENTRWAERFKAADQVGALLTLLADRIAHLPQLISIAAGTRQQELQYANRGQATP